MSAEEYNKIRRILFSTANNPHKGFTTAYEWLNGSYCKKLGVKGFAGMMAELKFYEIYQKEFKLTVAGDMGEHADFSGIYNNNATRFDITTNISYKAFKDYEPFLGDGINYKIAICDKDNFEVIDVLDLCFKKCSCGGYLIPFILLLDQNYNSRGESNWTNDQVLMNVCSDCTEFEEIDRWSHHFLLSPSEYASGLQDDISFEEQQQIIDEYCLNHYKFFRRQFNDSIMGVAEHSYKLTGTKGQGFWTFNYNFINKVVIGEMPLDVDCGRII